MFKLDSTTTFLFKTIITTWIILGSCVPGPLFGSQQDSIQNLIRMSRDDTTRVKLLLELSDLYPMGEESQSIPAALSALELAKKCGYPYGEMLANSKLGQEYKSLAEFDTSMMYYDRAIHLSDSLKEYRELAKYCNEYGSLFRRRGYNSTALEYHRKSLQIGQQINDSLQIANALVYAGMVHDLDLNYDTAMRYYYSALRYYEALKMDRNIGVALLNIGDTYKRLKDPQKALDFFQEGLSYFEIIGNTYLQGLAYNKIGTAHANLNNYDSALHYYQKCRVIYEDMNRRSGLAHLDINVGSVYLDAGDYNQALEHYDRAELAFTEMDFKEGLLNALQAKGSLFEEQGKYGEALETYFRCLEIARTVNPEDLLSVYEALYNVYKNIGDTKNAVEYHVLYSEMKDSIFQLDKVKIIADVELKYEKEKNVAKVLRMEKESLEKDIALERRTRQRNTYLYSGSSLVLILIFLFSYYSQRNRKNRVITEQRILQLEEEKKLLAARFLVEGQEKERKRIAKELHDGLGVLLSSAKMHFTTIQVKIPENKSLIDKATQLLEQASGDVRRISQNMMPGLLTKFGLFEAVEDLFEQVDAMEKIQARVNIEGEERRLNENTEIMLYRIIQEMVNNTLKHAEAKTINLQIHISPEKLDIRYTDDGKGFDLKEKLSSQTTLGMTNIKSRVKFLGGELDASSEPGKGVRYSFTISA